MQFGGRIGFDGYMPGDLNVTVRGEDMQLRLFEGVRSTFDADLALVGSYQAPTLGGTVMVKSALWTRRIDAPGSIFDFARGAVGGGSVIVGEAPRRRFRSATTCESKCPRRSASTRTCCVWWPAPI